MLLTINELSKNFGDRTVLSRVSLTLDSGQKIGLVGANGAGKTTLLKIIVGDLEADQGTVEIGRDVRIGYVPQTLAQAAGETIDAFINRVLGDLRGLEREMRRLETRMGARGLELEALLADYARLQARFERQGGYDLDHRYGEITAGLGIDYLDQARPMHSLSGGESTRVGLAGLLLAEPDLLLLDEPTNHLDFDALAWLEEYVQRYPGGVLIVSHDRRFLNRTVGAVMEIDEHAQFR